MKQYDLIIIGAGRSSNLAQNVAKQGKKVALIEKSSLGGTCANRGCALLNCLLVTQRFQELFKKPKNTILMQQLTKLI